MTPASKQEVYKGLAKPLVSRGEGVGPWDGTAGWLFEDDGVPPGAPKKGWAMRAKKQWKPTAKLMWSEGASVQQIARRLVLGDSTIYRWRASDAGRGATWQANILREDLPKVALRSALAHAFDKLDKYLRTAPVRAVARAVEALRGGVFNGNGGSTFSAGLREACVPYVTASALLGRDVRTLRRIVDRGGLVRVPTGGTYCNGRPVYCIPLVDLFDYQSLV